MWDDCNTTSNAMSCPGLLVSLSLLLFLFLVRGSYQIWGTATLHGPPLTLDGKILLCEETPSSSVFAQLAEPLNPH